MAEHGGVDMIPISGAMGTQCPAEGPREQNKRAGKALIALTNGPRERPEKARVREGQQTTSTEGRVIYHSRGRQGEWKCSTCWHAGPLSREVADGVLVSIWPAKQGGGGLLFSISPPL